MIPALLNPADNPFDLRFWGLLVHNFAPAVLPFAMPAREEFPARLASVNL